MAAIQRDPRAYELMTVFLPDMPDEDNQAQLDRVAGYISSAGGAVKETLTDSPWGRRRLAYSIRFNSVDYRDGFFSVYHFDAVPSAISDIERELKLDTTTMRYLLVHDDPKVGERFPSQDGETGEQIASPGSAEEPRAAAGESDAAGESVTSRATVDEEEPAATVAEDEVSDDDEEITEETPEQPDPEGVEAPASGVVEGEKGAESESDDEETDRE